MPSSDGGDGTVLCDNAITISHEQRDGNIYQWPTYSKHQRKGIAIVGTGYQIRLLLSTPPLSSYGYWYNYSYYHCYSYSYYYYYYYYYYY